MRLVNGKTEKTKEKAKKDGLVLRRIMKMLERSGGAGVEGHAGGRKNVCKQSRNRRQKLERGKRVTGKILD